MRSRATAFLLAALAVAPTASWARQATAPASAKQGYHVIKQTQLGGEGNWDYVTVDPDVTARYPAEWGTKVAFIGRDGAVVERTAAFPRGNPENPVDTASLERKLVALVTSRLGPELARRALGGVRAVHERGDMAEAFREFGVVEVG